MKRNLSVNILLLIGLLIIVVSCEEEALPPTPVTDIEGNIYKTVSIGNQTWMAENLKTTRYNDGTVIPLVTSSAAWGNLSTPGYCWYNNDEAKYRDTCGALYNGYAVNTGRLCPTGWHVPSRDDWQQLRDFAGDSITAGGHLKEAGTTHWLTPNKGADNNTGFKAMAAGLRYFEGSYASILYCTCFWSSSETGLNDEWYTSLYYGDAVFSLSHKSKKQGFSIRCIKD